MENITIIATIKAKENTDYRNISDNTFLLQAKQEGNIYTLKEFEYLCNKDEVNINTLFIRVLEISKDSFDLK